MNEILFTIRQEYAYTDIDILRSSSSLLLRVQMLIVQAFEEDAVLAYTRPLSVLITAYHTLHFDRIKGTSTLWMSQQLIKDTSSV